MANDSSHLLGKRFAWRVQFNLCFYRWKDTKNTARIYIFTSNLQVQNLHAVYVRGFGPCGIKLRLLPQSSQCPFVSISHTRHAHEKMLNVEPGSNYLSLELKSETHSWNMNPCGSSPVVLTFKMNGALTARCIHLTPNIHWQISFLGTGTSLIIFPPEAARK